MKVSLATGLRYILTRFVHQKKAMKKCEYNQRRNLKTNRNVAIAIATNAKFLKQACVMVQSLENIQCNVTLYLLNVTLNRDEVEKIRTNAPSNVRAVEIPIDETLLKKLKISDKWPIEAWARIMIPELVPEKEVLYLDVDTVVVDDISDMFLKYEDSTICGVKSTFYAFHGMKETIPNAVNSGVLLFNCTKLRKMNFTRKVVDYAHTHYDELQMPDQDSINYVCRHIMENLPPCYNAMNYFFAMDYKGISRLNREPYYSEGAYNEAKREPKVIHYNGGPFKRPWQKGEIKHPYWKIYQFYLNKVT